MLSLLLAVLTASPIVSLEPLGRDGAWTGFRLVEGQAVRAEVRWAALGNLAAGRMARAPARLRFEGLRAVPTPTLAADSFVEVRLPAGSPYPEIRFRLRLERFDAAAWKAAHGEVPFAFLALPQPGSEILFHRGWSLMTPVLDDFPLHLAGTGFAQQLTSSWSRDWTYAPPLAACPLPTVGLWRPSTGTFAALDFSGARLSDHSERELGVAYCWRQAAGGAEAREFVTGVWPAAQPYRTGLRLPELPRDALLESWCRLVWSAELPAWDDPNRLVQRFVWQTYAAGMPTAPPAGDLSWLSAPYRLWSFPGAELPRALLSRTAPDDTGWWGPSSLVFGGLDIHADPARLARERGQVAELDQFARAVRELVDRGTWMDLGGERCFGWRQPLEGGNSRVFGPGSETVRHASNFGAALAVLACLQSDPAAHAELLPVLDGLLRYCRQVLTTRNCYPDVAAAQFSWPAGPAVEFCYRYQFAFAADPARAELARQAGELAHALVYRYLTMYPADNDPDDGLDSSFLFEPNAGINWLGAACANECWINLDALARVYAHTGDPILGHYLLGALERWHVMYRDEDRPSVADFGNGFAELYGLYDGGPIARGKRASFGGLWGGAEQTFWPVGTAEWRVVGGEAAALTFGERAGTLHAVGYRAVPGGTAFVLQPVGDARFARPVDLVVTRLHRNLRGLPVRVGGELVPAGRLTWWPQRPDSVLVRGVPVGVPVQIGQPLAPGDEPPPLAKPRSGAVAAEQHWPAGFAAVDLASRANRAYWFDYDDNASQAGWEPGRKRLYGIPFELLDPRWNGGRLALRDGTAPLTATGRHLFALLGERTPGARLTVRYADGRRADADLSLAFRALTGWPPCLTWSVDLLAVPLDERPLAALEVQGASLFAATVASGPPERIAALLKLLEAQLEAERQAARAGERLRALKPLFEQASGQIAVLPTGESSGIRSHPVYRALRREGLTEHLVMLTPEQLVDPRFFGRQRFRLALYLGHEEYVQTVRQPGDGDAAIQRFLAGGGTLLLLAYGPYPFYYNQAGQAVGNAGLVGLELRQSWEQPPPGRLTFRRNREQTILRGLPDEFAFPITGDLRFRPSVAAAARPGYTPLLTLFDQAGANLGDGAAWVEHRDGPLAGGQVGYVWSTLLLDPAYQTELAADLLEHALKVSQLGLAEGAAIGAAAPPVIDGSPDDAVWRLAPSLPLAHAFLESSGAPRQPTDLRAAWDDEALYLLFEATDADIWSTITERDGPLWEGEVVEAYLDPDGDGRSYKELELSPIGTVIDLDIESPAALGQVDRLKLWNAPGWRTAVAVEGTIASRADADHRWWAEMAIPWRDLGVPAPRPGETWRAQFYRIDRPGGGAKPEFSGWSPTDTFHNPSRFGRLRFAAAPTASAAASQLEQTLWTIDTGRWELRDGVLVGSECVADGWFPVGLRLGTRPLGDLRLELTFRLLEPGGDHRDGLWIGFRDDGGGNGYALNLGANEAQLHKFSRGRGTDDTSPLARAPLAADGRSHTVAIVTAGEQIAVTFDGRPLLAATDRGLLGVPAPGPGQVILCARLWSQSAAVTRVAIESLRLEAGP